jgi:5-hydroxyisourate hydrolase
MGRLTTHILDTASGRPAAGLVVELWRVDAAHCLNRITTNADGRMDGPVIEGAAFTTGIYELRFRAGDYWRSCGIALAEPAFLDVIPVRFGIADPSQHYHVPLLLSPYGYSTYRGS